MLARIRKAQEKEGGFTLIELLVVMIIIGILAAIAIPVFLSQRAKARDSATKADISTVGKEVATYYVDGTGGLTLAIAAAADTATPSKYGAGDWLLTQTTGGAYVTSGNLSSGSALVAGDTAITSSTAWCASLTNADGSQKTYRYSVTGGLEAGECP